MESPHPRKIRRQFYQVLGDPKFSRTSGGGTFKVCKGFKVFHTFFWKGWGCKGKSLLKFFAYSKINPVLLKIFLSEYCHAIKNKLIYNRLCHGTGRKINILRTYL